MPAVEIAQHWVDELASLHPEATTIDIKAVVNEALQQYAYRQRQAKLARERQWYEANHEMLVQQYYGQYIGIHNSQVIDSDADGSTLSKRLRYHYGRVAVAIIYVDTDAKPPILHIRSPKLSLTS